MKKIKKNFNNNMDQIKIFQFNYYNNNNKLKFINMILIINNQIIKNK